MVPGGAAGRITAIFLAAIPTASIIGGPLSGFILRTASGARGLSGWQWLFVIETIPSLLLGLVTILYLRDRVEDVPWLDPAEKQVIAGAIARESAEKSGHSHVAQAFTDARVWLLGVSYFSVVCGIYIISFWLPSLIKHSGVADPLAIGLLTAIPYLAAIVVMVAVNASGDRMPERRWHTLLPALACAAGLAVAGLYGAAAGGIAFVNSLGNVGGFVSTYLVGWMTDLTHSPAAALYLFAAIVGVGALLIPALPARLVNK